MSDTKQIDVDASLFESMTKGKRKPRTPRNVTPRLKKKVEIPVKTVHKVYSSFGKKNRTVKVYLKNVKEYNKIDRDKAKLSAHSMEKVRSYLIKHHLIKVGSAASDELLREMYMNANLTGNVENSRSETLIDNFLNTRQ